MDCQGQVQDYWDMYFQGADLGNIDYDTIDLALPPPEDEPYRQYYFIAKCRKYVKTKSREIQRPLMFNCRTMGCQMNAQFGNP